MNYKIKIIGCGSFGTSLAHAFSKIPSQKISIFTRSKKKQEEINLNSKNYEAFGDFQLNKSIEAVNSIEEIFLFEHNNDFLILIIALPSHALDTFIDEIKEKIDSHHEKIYIIFCTKGISKTGYFFDEIITQKFNSSFDNFGFLFGPSFSNEILHSAQTFINLISKNQILSRDIMNFFNSHSIFHNIFFFFEDDIRGAQICSMMKNICAIFIGILRGYGVDDDLCAAFFTLFFQEIKLLVSFFSNDHNIIFSFSGIGDLFLTSTSLKSRNFCFGFDIGQNIKLKSKDEMYYYINSLKKPEGFFALNYLFNSFINRDDIFSSNGFFSKSLSKKLFNFLTSNNNNFLNIDELMNFNKNVSDLRFLNKTIDNSINIKA